MSGSSSHIHYPFFPMIMQILICISSLRLCAFAFNSFIKNKINHAYIT
jgi:hypothetical protein